MLSVPFGPNQDDQDHSCPSLQSKKIRLKKVGKDGPDRPGLRLPPSGSSQADMFERPPWHVASSLELATALGVSLQTIANWRIRSVGPPALPKGHFRGNRSYYVVEEVLAWLSDRRGEPRAGWLFSRDYLTPIFPIDPEMQETALRDMITWLEANAVFTRRWKAQRE